MGIIYKRLAMNKILQTAKTYKIEYKPLGIFNLDTQNILACIFQLFQVRINKENIFVDEYEVEREQLYRLRESISKRDIDFQKYAKTFELELKQAKINTDMFLQILDNLIEKSDQQNPMVVISWQNEGNTPLKKNLDYIKALYVYSDVCMSEMLASVPADGLTLEEAFELYVEAMKWLEHDRFYQEFEEGGRKEL